MKSLYLIVFTCLFLSACGGGGGGVAESRPSGEISGVASDNLLSGADITISTLSGSVVGEGVTDDQGRYSIELDRVPSQILKVVATNGQYTEESSGKTVDLSGDDALIAFVDYEQGEVITSSLTYLTTLAAGFSEYLIERGADETDALSRGIRTISELFNIDIQNTMPLDITDPANSNGVLTESHRYSFILAALSETTRMIGEVNNADEHSLYSSIKFVKQAYQDIKADGVLDGMGDSGVLFMGIYPLTVDTYRHTNAVNILVMANHDNNKTNIRPDQLKTFAESLNRSNHPAFESAPVIGFDSVKPDIKSTGLTSGEVVFGDFDINLIATDKTGITQISVQVGSADPVIIENYDGTNIVLDTRSYPEGQQSVTIIVTNELGAFQEIESNIIIANSESIISGVALVSDALVTAYDFAGEVVGSSRSDDDGAFSIVIDRGTDSQALNIVASGGRYVEDFSGKSVQQSENDQLSTWVDFKGSNIATTISYFTTVAAGYVDYLRQEGVSVSEAIAQANQSLSTIYGFDIALVTPLNITDVRNANISLNSGLKYGFSIAAISATTAQISSANGVSTHSLYNTSTFAQVARNDISFDGLLNGIGVQGDIRVGVVPISVDTYRHLHALNTLNVANSERNKTSLLSPSLLIAATALNGSNHPIFGSETITPINDDKPEISAQSIVDNAIIFGVVNLSFDASAFTGINQLSYRIDDGNIIPFTGQNIDIDTTLYSDGSHTLKLIATSHANGTTQLDISVVIANQEVVVEGTAFDNLLKGAIITVMTLNGEIVGDGITDEFGYYSVSLQRGIPSQPLKLVATYGQYTEEFSKEDVVLKDGDALYGMINYEAGQDISTSLTYLTTIATGYAEFLIGTGLSEDDAIDQSNTIISSAFDLNIIATQPEDILDVKNASPFLTDELQYAFTTAAASLTTADISDTNVTPMHSIYNSITFSETAYQDIKYDGILNGVDSKGTVTMGTVQLSTDSYRHTHALNMLIMANHPNNRTGLDAQDLFPAAKALNDSEHIIFGSAPVISLDNTKPKISLPNWEEGQVVAGNIDLSVSVFDVIGVDSVVLKIDNEEFSANSLTSPIFNIDTSLFTDGLYSVVITAENTVGGSTTFSRDITIANTGTAISNIVPSNGSYIRGTTPFSAVVSDPIGLSSVDFIIDDLIVIPQNDLTTPIYNFDTSSPFLVDGAHTFKVSAENLVGYVEEVEIDFYVDNQAPSFDWSLATESYFDENYIFDVTITDNLGIAKAELRIDGILLNDFGADGTQTSIRGRQEINYLSYAQGQHTLTLEVEDQAGSIKASSKTIYFDHVDPVLSISNTPNSKISGLFDLKFVATDSLGFNNNAVKISIDDVEQGIVDANAGLYTIDPSSFTEGQKEITVTVVDRSGRETSRSVAIDFGHIPLTIGSAWVGNERNCDMPSIFQPTISCVVDFRLPLTNIQQDEIQSITGLFSGWSIETINGVVNVVRVGITECYRCSGGKVRTITITDTFGLSVTKSIFGSTREFK